MQQETEKTEFSFDELDDSAKETARAWWRETPEDYDWHDVIYEDFDRVAEIIGLEVIEKQFSGFSCQGDGASFSGRCAHKPGAFQAICEYAPQDKTLRNLVYQIQVEQLTLGNQAIIKITFDRSNYCHDGVMDIDVEMADESELPQERYDRAVKSFTESFRGLARWLYRQLEQEYDYMMSDENVDENIRINEYQFDEYGAIA